MDENLKTDQVQQDSPQETVEPKETKGPKVIKKDQASEEQSETTKTAEEAKPQLYTDHLGREMTAEQLHQEYLKTQSYITKLEKERLDSETRNERAAEQAVSQNKLLEDVDPNVKAAIIEIVKGPINEALQAREKEAEAKLSQEKFNQRLNELEKKYPGKFNKLEILREMQRPENEIYDPEVLYQKLHWDSYLDDQIKAALKGKSGSNQTESTSTEAPRKPGETKPPTTWAEASKNAISRL